jgi:hydroxyacylglutathione hydrolase
MPLIIQPFILGPLENNSYLLIEEKQKIAVVIDPPFGSEKILEYIHIHHLSLEMILITHAHFDHIGGINLLIPPPPHTIEIYLHPDDQQLWEMGGSAAEFGFMFESPTLQPKQVLHLQEILFGGSRILCLHTPGHTPGHVVYYLPEEKTVFCGDLIFYHGVGRTDLPGGSGRQLIQSIEKNIFTLPDNVLLCPGHGPETMVGEEKMNNPFLI